jgi:hypothetical protein
MIRNRAAREVAKVVFITALVVSAFITGRQMDDLRSDLAVSSSAARTNKQSVVKSGEILADVCKAAPARNLKQAGREQECDKAKAGNIEEVVPVVEPQTRTQTSRQQIEQVVDAYLDNRLRELPGQYRDDLRRAVVDYLRANPPRNGRDGKDGKTGPAPTAAQIAPLVASYVAAHPPPAGKDGQDGADGADGETGPAGVSVTGAALEGCDLVFTFSNETEVRVGPICGAKGETGAKGDKGDKGDTGDAGQDGDPGRGIVSTNCVGGDDVDQDGNGTAAATDWLITYDRPDADGRTSQRVDGPCRIEPGEGGGNPVLGGG